MSPSEHPASMVARMMCCLGAGLSRPFASVPGRRPVRVNQGVASQHWTCCRVAPSWIKVSRRPEVSCPSRPCGRRSAPSSGRKIRNRQPYQRPRRRGRSQLARQAERPGKTSPGASSANLPLQTRSPRDQGDTVISTASATDPKSTRSRHPD